MAYSTKVIDHYEHPRNVGSLDKSDENVGTGIVGAPYDNTYYVVRTCHVYDVHQGYRTDFVAECAFFGVS